MPPGSGFWALIFHRSDFCPSPPPPTLARDAHQHAGTPRSSNISPRLVSPFPLLARCRARYEHTRTGHTPYAICSLQSHQALRFAARISDGLMSGARKRKALLVFLSSIVFAQRNGVHGAWRRSSALLLSCFNRCFQCLCFDLFTVSGARHHCRRATASLPIVFLNEKRETCHWLFPSAILFPLAGRFAAAHKK